MAKAGPDQMVFESETVILDGSSSTDVDGNITSYLWKQQSGIQVDLSLTTVANPTFVAPKVELDNVVLQFSLTVTDNSGETAIDKVDITVQNVNIPPTAEAGPNQIVFVSDTVTLDGSSSTDSDGTIVSYHWNQFFGSPVTLSSSSDVHPMFGTSDVDLTENILKFRLTVTDNADDSTSDEVEIIVNTTDDGPGDDGPGDDGPGDDGPGDDGPGDDGPGDDRSNEKDEKNKVTICHVPPGNPNNAHTITVGESAVLTHMTQHGDTIGPCSGETSNEESSNEKSNDKNKKDKDSDKDEKGNSGKGNSDIDNSGKGNKNDEKGNSGKGNSGIDNSGKGNKNDEKGNSGKGNKNNDKEDRGNSGKDNSSKSDKNDQVTHEDENDHDNEDHDEDD
jgi:hypothetical protein